MKWTGAVLFVASALAQAPVSVKASCTAETVQALSLPCTSDEPCPLFLELADVDAVGNRVVLTGNVHTGSATIESVLLISEDGGRTWTEGHSRMTSAVLDQLQFLDFESGWINGHVLQSVPKDAFLLLTTDGGRTWRKRTIAGDGRTGAVEQFWFDTRKHGLVAIDRVRAGDSGFRYEVWESMTGGESWSIRQVNNQPLTIKKPERERVWRIQPHAASKTNRIEKREASGWVTAAAFAVSAGECKPAEPEPPPEPPVPSTPAPEPKTPSLQKKRQ